MNVHIQQNKLQVWGLRKQNGWWGQLDEHHLSGPVRLYWTPMIN